MTMSFLFNKSKKEKEAAKAASSTASANASLGRTRPNGLPSSSTSRPGLGDGRNGTSESINRDRNYQSQEPSTPPRAHSASDHGHAGGMQGRGPIGPDAGSRNVSTSTATGIPEPRRYREASGASSNDVFSSNDNAHKAQPNTDEHARKVSSNGSAPAYQQRARSPVADNDSPRSRRIKETAQGRGALPVPAGRKQTIVYPWSTRSLHQSNSIPLSVAARSPQFLNHPDQKGRLPPPGALGENPCFPRYGAAAASSLAPVLPSLLPNLNPKKDADGSSHPAIPHSGEMWMFGGLVGGVASAETYIISFPYQAAPKGTSRDASGSPNGLSVSFVETTGDCPSPRSGHAACFVPTSNLLKNEDGQIINPREGTLVVWGGYTRTREDEPLDGDLYLLTTATRRWHRIPLSHSSSGRYGHSMSIVGNKIYVWGGQDGEYLFDEMITFDLEMLRSQDFRWEGVQYVTVPPARRTGHVAAVFNGKLYFVGGSTASQCVSDTWVFDPDTKIWTELTCVGYIPTPRDGASAAVVGDVIYVFGGRNQQDQEVNDLAAFRIVNQRWYMFQNMGDAPPPRCGHALASIGAKIFVVGGEAYNPKPVLDSKSSPTMPLSEDHSQVGVLDTAKIKFPPASEPPKNNIPIVLDASRDSGAVEVRGLGEDTSQLTSDTTPRNVPIASQQAPAGADRRQTQQNFAADAPRGVLDYPREQVAIPNVPPESEGNMRKKGPSVSSDSSQVAFDAANARAPFSESKDAASSVRSRKSSDASRATSGPRDSVDLATAPRPMHHEKNDSSASRHSIDRSIGSPREVSTALLSSRRTQGVLSPPPSDAFYYSSDQSHSKSHDEVKDSSTLHTSVSEGASNMQGERRERALRAEIQMLRQSVNLSKGSPETRTETEDLISNRQILIEMVLDLRKELESTRFDLQEHQLIANQRISDAMRGRAAALQEAAALKSKVVSLTSELPEDSPLKVSEVQVMEMESRLGRALREKTAALSRLKFLEDKSTETVRYKDDVESQLQSSHSQIKQFLEERQGLLTEIAQLQDRGSKMSQTSRDHQAKSALLSRQLDQHKGNIVGLSDTNERLLSQNEVYVKTIAQLKSALEAATAHSRQAESMYQATHKELDGRNAEFARVQKLVSDLNTQLEAKSQEVTNLRAHADDLNLLLDQCKQENLALQGLTQGNVTQMLASRHQGQDDQSQDLNDDSRQTNALHAELESVRTRHTDLQESVRSLEDELAEVQSQLRQQGQKTFQARTALSEMQARLIATQNDLQRAQRQYNDREAELLDQMQGLEASEIRAGLLKSVVQENGLLIPSRSTTPADGHRNELNRETLQDRLVQAENQYAAIQAAQRSRSSSATQRSVSKMSNLSRDDLPPGSAQSDAAWNSREAEYQAKMLDATRQKDEALLFAASVQKVLDNRRAEHTRLEEEVAMLKEQAMSSNDTILQNQLDLATKELEVEKSMKQQHLTINEQYARQIRLLQGQIRALQAQNKTEPNSPKSSQGHSPVVPSTFENDVKQLSNLRTNFENRHGKKESKSDAGTMAE